MSTTKKGWIYAITCPLYASDGLVKVGMTEKVGALEEEVRTSLLTRYRTTLPNAEILHLIQVAHPAKAEKALLERVKDCLVQGEIARIDGPALAAHIDWLRREYDPESPYEMPADVLQKLLTRLSKKKAPATDLQVWTRVDMHLSDVANSLSPNNNAIIRSLINMMPYPPVTSTAMPWIKDPRNSSVLQMRISNWARFCQPNNWDRRDPKLHATLKAFLGIL